MSLHDARPISSRSLAGRAPSSNRFKRPNRHRSFGQALDDVKNIIIDSEMITGSQMKAARALLGIAQKELARLSGVSLPTIQRRSEEHTSELQSLMRISYAVFCFKKKTN